MTLRSLLALTILTLPGLQAQAAGPAATWVFFRDHGALSRPGPARERALHAAQEQVTPRALERRVKAARERGATPEDVDLPPDPSYIAAVTSRGGSIRTVSAWLNAISVDAPAAKFRVTRTSLSEVGWNEAEIMAAVPFASDSIRARRKASRC